MVTIAIPTALRQYAGGNASLKVEAGTISQILAQLVEQQPALGQQLYNEQGTLRSFVNIYVGDEDIRYLQNSRTRWRNGQYHSRHCRRN
jgi:sulfur-carrier protein